MVYSATIENKDTQESLDWAEKQMQEVVAE
jgi:hypothetical protein